jgi:hypothetical protein
MADPHTGLQNQEITTHGTCYGTSVGSPCLNIIRIAIQAQPSFLGDLIPLSLKQNSSAGEISHESSLVYHGEFDFFGLRSGYGFEVYTNGRIAYAGRWRKNLRDGEGSEFYPDGVLMVKRLESYI